MSAVFRLDALQQALQSEGIVAGLKFLNDRVPHRLTAIYRLSGAAVHCVHVYDKQGELTTDRMAVVPLGESFCQFAMRDGVFLTDDTTADRRLDGNPNQGVVVCYHGLPLLDNDASLYGTLCHFDFVPQALPDGEFDHLQQAAREIARHLNR
ncbi:MAG: GAF domain-containing protein [Haliea sp.]|nr:MAG: GAF domain-containing protein [Haliea sp.]